MPGLLVSKIPQCKKNHHNGANLEIFQTICHSEPTFNAAHQASKISWKVRSLKSRIKTSSFFEDNTTFSNEVFKYFVSDIAVGSWTLRNSTRVTVKRYVIVRHNAGSYILTLQLQARKSQTCETSHAYGSSSIQGHRKTMRLRYHHQHFSPWRQPMEWLWVNAVVLLSDYPRWKPKKCWH